MGIQTYWGYVSPESWDTRMVGMTFMIVDRLSRSYSERLLVLSLHI